MKGRKAIPSKIIDIRGGTEYTHRPARAQEPRPPEKIPPCPKALDDIARKEWRRAVKILGPIGLLTQADMSVLAAYCESFSRWTQAMVQIQKLGMVYKRKDGTPGYNPWYRVLRESYDQMLKAGTLIGLSPSSRASLKVEKPKPRSKFEEFLSRKHETPEV